eukprot:2437818-Lingulodinium_polyedra.AAC.1
MDPVLCPACNFLLPCHARYLDHVKGKKHKRAAGIIPSRSALAPAWQLTRECASCYLRMLFI